MSDEAINTPTPIKPSNFEDVRYSLSITKLKTETVDGIEGVVTEVEYALKGTYEPDDLDGKVLVKEFHSSINFVPSEINVSGSFVPFNELTESQVKQWVESVYPEVHLKYSVANILLARYESIIDSNQPNLPWMS